MDDPAMNDSRFEALLEAMDLQLGKATGPGPLNAGSTGGTAAFEDLRLRCQNAFAESAVGGATDNASEAFRVRRVTGRILRATTQEDLGPAGDLRILLRFVGNRLRDSRSLRVLAAVLLAQVTVVPVVAYHLLKEARPSAFNLEFSKHYEELLDDMPVLEPGRDYHVPDMEIDIQLPSPEEYPPSPDAPK